ncbi:MFS transporter [Massilia suwonensis]|uniref:MFS transporter n=1 Tax=Massilia suwonensis TaxID=648895 RepID=A0ABW0MW86_9BURK
MKAQWRTIGILAPTQIISWGSLYYAFSILGPRIREEMGWGTELVFGAYSWSLLVAGLAATPVGILLDRHGGRRIMGAGSVLCGIGLIALGAGRTPLAYLSAWTALGLAMGMTLYEAAFATINRRYAGEGRQVISTLTLFAGFASTLFWPLTQALDATWGWRATYFWYAALQFLVCLPLHLLLGGDTVRPAVAPRLGNRSHTLAEALRHPAFWKLTAAFAAHTLVFAVLSVHLIPLLQGLGHSARLAVLMSMLIGPMQVAGRVLERTVGRAAAPELVGKYCFAALPAALASVLLFGTQAWAIAGFCILYGLSNGVLTIVRGTLPQALFGSANYGAISGAMAGPSLVAKAAGPVVGAMLLARHGTPELVLVLLFAAAAVSVCFYFAAVRAQPAINGKRPASGALDP